MLGSDKFNKLLATVIVVVLAAVGLYVIATGRAASPQQVLGTCTLTQNDAGSIMAAGSGLKPNTQYQWELYQAGGGSVGGNQFTTTASGTFSNDLGLVSWYKTNFGINGTINVAYDVYPILGNKARLGTILASCSNTF